MDVPQDRVPPAKRRELLQDEGTLLTGLLPIFGVKIAPRHALAPVLLTAVLQDEAADGTIAPVPPVSPPPLVQLQAVLRTWPRVGSDGEWAYGHSFGSHRVSALHGDIYHRK